MPNIDGTGPLGHGSQTGKKMGNCYSNTDNSNQAYRGMGFGRRNRNRNGNGNGCGRGRRRGFGWRNIFNFINPKKQD